MVRSIKKKRRLTFHFSQITQLTHPPLLLNVSVSAQHQRAEEHQLSSAQLLKCLYYYFIKISANEGCSISK